MFVYGGFMTLENKLGISDQVELAREEERLSKMRARELFEEGILNELTAGSVKSLFEIHSIYSKIFILLPVRFAPSIYPRADFALPQSCI